MSNQAKTNDGWGSRIGYILSTLGMSVGVGAMWRFPMLCAQYGGGAFVLAFVIVTILAVIPAGWAESALGRKYKMSAVGVFGKLAGKKGTAFGYLMAITPLGLMFYYPIIMGTVLVYIFYAVAGAPFLNDVVGFYDQVNANRPVIYACVVAIILVTALISLKGIQKGVEKACKVLLPVMFIFLIIICVRVFTIPGIAEGIEFYVNPDWSQLGSASLWTTAAGMALFAVGLGPGYLLTYGMYLSDDADLATDFVTVNVTQLLICVLCGFATIPAVIKFGLDPLAGKGLIFQSLPLVFNEISGGMIWFVLFMVALFFAGLSTTLSMMEIPATCMMDAFGWDRKKSICAVTVISIIGAIPCVWSDAFFAFFDNLVGNVFYSVTAAVVALFLAWFIGAKKIREEWYNPTSAIKWGSWVDILYKFIAVPAFAYFGITAILTLF